jgi:Domain of unknown function (DUF1330)
MPAYIVVQVNVKDPGKYEEYGTAWNVQSFIEDYGGEFIMMSNGPEARLRSRAMGPNGSPSGESCRPCALPCGKPRERVRCGP